MDIELLSVTRKYQYQDLGYCTDSCNWDQQKCNYRAFKMIAIVSNLMLTCPNILDYGLFCVSYPLKHNYPTVMLDTDVTRIWDLQVLL